MQISISYSNLQLFKFSYNRSDFSFSLTKNPSLIRSFSKNSGLHCSKTQKMNRNNHFIYPRKAVSTIYISVLVMYSSTYNSQWIVVDKAFSTLCCLPSLQLFLWFPVFISKRFDKHSLETNEQSKIHNFFKKLSRFCYFTRNYSKDLLLFYTLVLWKIDSNLK